MNAWWDFTAVAVAVLVALLGGVFIGAGMMRDHMTPQIGYAFGCGRFYADNNDPALDPRNDESPCYPYYKAWDATEWHPPK